MYSSTLVLHDETLNLLSCKIHSCKMYNSMWRPLDSSIGQLDNNTKSAILPLENIPLDEILLKIYSHCFSDVIFDVEEDITRTNLATGMEIFMSFEKHVRLLQLNGNLPVICNDNMFVSLIEIYKHNIFHFCHSVCCCQCSGSCILPKANIIKPKEIKKILKKGKSKCACKEKGILHSCNYLPKKDIDLSRLSSKCVMLLLNLIYTDKDVTGKNENTGCFELKILWMFRLWEILSVTVDKHFIYGILDKTRDEKSMHQPTDVKPDLSNTESKTKRVYNRYPLFRYPETKLHDREYEDIHRNKRDFEFDSKHLKMDTGIEDGCDESERKYKKWYNQIRKKKKGKECSKSTVFLKSRLLNYSKSKLLSCLGHVEKIKRKEKKSSESTAYQMNVSSPIIKKTASENDNCYSDCFDVSINVTGKTAQCNHNALICGPIPYDHESSQCYSENQFVDVMKHRKEYSTTSVVDEVKFEEIDCLHAELEPGPSKFYCSKNTHDSVISDFTQPIELQSLEEVFKEDLCLDIDQLRNDDLGDVKTSESTELISIERHFESGSLFINLDNRSEMLTGTTMSSESSCMSCYGLSNDAPDSIPQSLESFDSSFDNRHILIDTSYQDVHAKQSKGNYNEDNVASKMDAVFIDLSAKKNCHIDITENTATYFPEQDQNYKQSTTLESSYSKETSQYLELINIPKPNEKFRLEHGSELNTIIHEQFLHVYVQNDLKYLVHRKLEDTCHIEKLKDPVVEECEVGGRGQIETIGHINDSCEAIQTQMVLYDLDESCRTEFEERAKICKDDNTDSLYSFIHKGIFNVFKDIPTCIFDHLKCISKSTYNDVIALENGKKSFTLREILKNSISLYFPCSAVQRDFRLPTTSGFSEDLVNKTYNEEYVLQTECCVQILNDSSSYFSSKAEIEEFCFISVHPNELCKLWDANIALRSTRYISELINRPVSDKTIDTEEVSLQTKTENLYQIHLGNTEPSIPLELKEFITFMEVNAKEEENNKEMSQQLKQLLRKFNVKATFAEKKMKLDRSKMKHILKHTRQLTLEQLMQCFFKNLSAEIPDKGMKESSNKLLNHIFNYLPIRYESKLYVFPINGLQQYFQQMSVPLSSRPAHAETMKFEWVRVRSFWSFPSNIKVSPIAMARVGFYYTGKCAECRCFSCGHVYKEWKDGDDPYLIHQQISPTCFYLNGRESGNVPIHEEDRITPRHNVEQSLVSVAAPVYAARAAAEAEAVVIPGINSAEIASIPVPVLAPMQGGLLGASQSGDFSFRSPTTSSTAVTTQQASSSYFARPANPSQNVGQPAASASLQGRTSNFSPTKSSSGLPTTQSQEVTTTQQFNISGQQNMPQQSTEGSAGKPAVGLGLPPASQFSEGSVLSGPVRTSSPATVTQTPASITVPTTASTTVPTTVAVSSTPTAVTVSSTQPSQATLTTSTTSSTGGISRSPSSSSTSQTAAPVQTTTTSTSSNTASSSSTTVGSESSRSRFDPLGINFEKPRYPAYAVLTVRVNTYNGWPSYLDQTPRTMSLAGFFYAGYGDYTRCFFCGGGLRNWEAGDDPWVEHARWFPKCAFLRQNRGEDFINMVQTRHQEAESTNQPILLPRQLSVLDQGMPLNVMSSIPVQTLREMGKEDGIINEAIDRWRAARRQEGRGNDNMEMQATAIYEIILQIEDERAQITTQASSLLPAQTSSQLSVGFSAAERNEPAAGEEGTAAELPSYLQGFDKILDEYEEQKERLTCTICTENPVAIAFLPCGHLVCCLDCAPAMRKCPICNELVKGTIKTFFP